MIPPNLFLYLFFISYGPLRFYAESPDVPHGLPMPKVLSYGLSHFLDNFAQIIDLLFYYLFL